MDKRAHPLRTTSQPSGKDDSAGRRLKTRADKSGKVFGWDTKKKGEVELGLKQMRRLETNVTVADVIEGEGYALLSVEEYAEKRRLEGESSSSEEESDEENEKDGGERKQAKLLLCGGEQHERAPRPRHR